MRVILDTNIVLRARQSGHPQQPLANAAVARLVLANDVSCVVPQVCYEFWAVATRPIEENGFGLTTKGAEAAIRDVFANALMLLDPPDLLKHWLELCIRHDVKGKKAHDARIAAAAQLHEAAVLTFNDADFRRFGVQTIVP